MASSGNDAYPVTFDVTYPDRNLNRWTTLFRVILAIPILILVYFLVGIIFLPVLLMLLFREKYPGWWFNWNLELLRFGNRINAYLLLLNDEYPSTDEEQTVHLNYPDPDGGRELNRWLPLVKWFLAIPHYIVLLFLGIAALVVVIIAWFAILFTGRYPRGLFNFVVGVMRWQNRVTGYALTLVTDKYPPFRLGD